MVRAIRGLISSSADGAVHIRPVDRLWYRDCLLFLSRACERRNPKMECIKSYNIEDIRKKGIAFEDVEETDNIVIQTQNSTYHFSVVDPLQRRVMLCGGSLGEDSREA